MPSSESILRRPRRRSAAPLLGGMLLAAPLLLVGCSSDAPNNETLTWSLAACSPESFTVAWKNAGSATTLIVGMSGEKANWGWSTSVPAGDTSQTFTTSTVNGLEEGSLDNSGTFTCAADSLKVSRG